MFNQFTLYPFPCLPGYGQGQFKATLDAEMIGWHNHFATFRAGWRQLGSAVPAVQIAREGHPLTGWAGPAGLSQRVGYPPVILILAHSQNFSFDTGIKVSLGGGLFLLYLGQNSGGFSQQGLPQRYIIFFDDFAYRMVKIQVAQGG
jgi:hypothetical protein